MAWMHYNPQRADAATLDGMTGGASRLALLGELLGVLGAERERQTRQHQLLIGPRGSGKTHILRVLVHRLRQDPDLDAAWWPVVLPEEVSLRGPADLVSVVLAQLAADLGSSTQATARAACLEALAQERGSHRGQDAMELAWHGVQRAAAALGRSLLVVAENLDAVLYLGPGGSRQRSADEQWALRRLLQAEGRLLLVGAAPSQFGAVSAVDAPFHGFFRTHHLESLSLDEVLEIARRHLALVADTDGDAQRAGRARGLHERFEEHRGRLAGMLRVTGGLPRFAHLVVELLMESDDAGLHAHLDRLLDEQTPYFQTRLDPRLLAPGEVEVLAELARSPGPARPSDIRDRVGVPTSEVSVLLERLRERGLARRAGSHAGASRWDVAEPLYRVWMAFREGGAVRNHLVVLADVVAALYDQGELEEGRKKAAAEARSAHQRLAMLDAALTTTLPAAEGGADDDRGSEEVLYQKMKREIERLRPDAGRPLAFALVHLGLLAIVTGRHDEAKDIAKEALARTTDDVSLHASALRLAGQVLIREDPPRAVEHLGAAAHLFDELGKGDDAADCRVCQAQALDNAGRTKEARFLLDVALKWAEEHRDERLATFARVVQAELAPREQERARWLEVVKLAGTDVAAAYAHLWLGSDLAREDEAAGLDHLTEARRVFESFGRHPPTQLAARDIGRIHARAGRLGEAGEAWFAAIDEMREYGVVGEEPVFADLTGLALQSDPDLAERTLRVLAAAAFADPPVRVHGERALLDVAVRLLAKGPAERAHELLVIAHGDLPAERRALLDPFLLAARCDLESAEAVLLEQSEQMRAVVGDVRARVDKVRASLPLAPSW
ncbi:MAG: MarR family transcriptional regulator [Deltaproteobacteria bacterium]|nr:MarR family transcriptional regulator [Deltaproteobacteria bacterium]